MKTGIVLSGCGVMDGTEIHEAVLTMLHLDRAGSEAVCIAPDADQMHVVNHISNEAIDGERRNMLLESARIARGAVRDICTIQAGDIDALVFPGGFGAAKNLCTFAIHGKDCSVDRQVERLIMEMYEAGKPVGALCIAPVLVARVLGGNGHGVSVTIGNDKGVAEAIRAMGAVHVEAPVHEAVVDPACRVVTSPAYMLATGIKEVSESARAMVDGLVGLL